MNSSPFAPFPSGTLDVDALACRRGGRLLIEDVAFRLESGMAAVVTGANGAGKSSLLRALAGLALPAAGTIAWDGADISEDRDAHRSRVAYVGHLDGIKPALTAAEDLAFEADQLGGGDIRAALAAMGIEALGSVAGRFYSAGQRRRLALARLALGSRPLWLLDEPTNGLDRDGIAAFETLIADHRAKGGIVIAATHVTLDLGPVMQLEIGA